MSKIEYLALCLQYPTKTKFCCNTHLVNKVVSDSAVKNLVVNVVGYQKRDIRSHGGITFRMILRAWLSTGHLPKIDMADEKRHGWKIFLEIKSRNKLVYLWRCRSLENPVFWTSEVWSRGLKLGAVACGMYNAWYQIMVIILWNFSPY